MDNLSAGNNEARLAFNGDYRDFPVAKWTAIDVVGPAYLQATTYPLLGSYYAKKGDAGLPDSIDEATGGKAQPAIPSTGPGDMYLPCGGRYWIYYNATGTTPLRVRVIPLCGGNPEPYQRHGVGRIVASYAVQLAASGADQTLTIPANLERKGLIIQALSMAAGSGTTTPGIMIALGRTPDTTYQLPSALTSGHGGEILRIVGEEWSLTNSAMWYGTVVVKNFTPGSVPAYIYVEEYA